MRLGDNVTHSNDEPEWVKLPGQFSLKALICATFNTCRASLRGADTLGQFDDSAGCSFPEYVFSRTGCLVLNLEVVKYYSRVLY